MSVTVEVAGVTFSNVWAPDASGVAFTFSRLDPWYGGGDVRLERSARMSAHGEFQQRGWRGGKAVVLEGWASCPDRAAAAVVVERLAAVLADGEVGDLRVVDPHVGVRTSRVQLAAEPTVDWSRSETDVFFQFPMLAADPLRYGDHVTSAAGFPEQRGGLEYDLYTDGAGTDLGYLDYGDLGATGTVTLTNSGTADSWPQFDVAGPVESEGFEVVRVGTGERLVFAGAVPTSSSLVLDSASGNVVIDGTADRAGLLTVREWSPVRPGESAQFVFLPRGARTDAVLTASLRPAYW